MLKNYTYLLAEMGYKVFDGWHLTRGIWVDSARILFIVLAGVTLIMLVAYWKSLITNDKRFEGVPRSYLALGMCGFLSSALYTQILKLGHILTPVLPICLASVIVVLIGLLHSRAWKS